jgi:hypothetical protein
MSQVGEAGEGNAAAGTPDAGAGAVVFAAVGAAAIVLPTSTDPGSAGPLSPRADNLSASTLSH